MQEMQNRMKARAREAVPGQPNEWYMSRHMNTHKPQRKTHENNGTYDKHKSIHTQGQTASTKHHTPCTKATQEANKNDTMLAWVCVVGLCSVWAMFGLRLGGVLAGCGLWFGLGLAWVWHGFGRWFAWVWAGCGLGVGWVWALSGLCLGQGLGFSWAGVE